MANDKSRHGDNPPGSPSLLQWFDEIEKNEAATFRGPVNSTNTVGADRRTVPDPLVPCFPLPGTEGMSNPYAKKMPLNLMNDFTTSSNSQNPVPADSSVYGKGLLPISDSDFLFCEGNTDFGYSVTPHSVIDASSKICDLQNPYVDRELVSATGSAAAVNSVQQHGDLDSNTSRPQLIDNFTSDGDITPMSWPTLDGSCLTLGIGCKPNDLSVRNVGFDSERDVLPRLNIFHSQNTNRSLHLSPDVPTRFSSAQNSMQQIEKQQQFLVPGNINVEGNCDERSFYFDANNGTQSYPAVPILPFDNRLARLPDSGLSKVNELSLSSWLNMSTSLPLSDQSQKHQMESGTRNTSMHNQSGKLFTANEGVAAHVAERGLFPEEFRFSQLASNPHQSEVASALLSSTNLPGSVITGQEMPNTKFNRAVQPSRALFGTSVKRAAAETLTATSHAEASKTRRTQSSTGLSVEAPFPEVSSLKVSSHDASFASRDRTSPSLLHQAKSTTLNKPQSQMRSVLPPEVKGLSSLIRDAPSRPLQARSAPLLPPSPWTASSLPPQVRSIPSLSSLSQTYPSLPLQAKSIPFIQSLSQTTSLAPQVDISSLPSLSHTSSIQTQAMSIPSLPTTTSYIPTKSRGNELLQHQAQMAHFLLPQAQTTTSLPFSYMTVPSLLPIANTTSPPTLSQNCPSWPLQPQNASSLPSQHTIGRPLPPKSLRSSPLPQKPRTALPPRSQIASSLSSNFSVPSALLPQSQTASPVPRKCIAPPSSTAPPTTEPVTQKVNVRPLPPQRQTDPVFHIKWNADDETQLIGHKCLICKRDLAFTPEGPVSVPPIAPMVAVLPCGHTFHDHCLHLITPKDEVKSPPCIPCAIGES